MPFLKQLARQIDFKQELKFISNFPSRELSLQEAQVKNVFEGSRLYWEGKRGYVDKIVKWNSRKIWLVQGHWASHYKTNGQLRGLKSNFPQGAVTQIKQQNSFPLVCQGCLLSVQEHEFTFSQVWDFLFLLLTAGFPVLFVNNVGYFSLYSSQSPHLYCQVLFQTPTSTHSFLSEQTGSGFLLCPRHHAREWG